MKTPRTTKVAVVIGRNKRVYARGYKMEKSIKPFAERYLQREAERAKEEGFIPCGMDFSRPDDTIYEYVIRYKEA